MKENEKRGAPRVAYISEVVCESAGNRLTARTSDISASGVFIHSKLWCEAGSILMLRFSVPSTQIETSGEVCYSIPHIGMGIRFLDLKPEYRAAIERLIESERDQGECEKVKTQGQRIIPSGVEPVDKLLGGLERGHLYLAHGDASGKSLFGIEFLIEGLKHGQPGAFITPNRRDNAVRRFARLGYDCLRDIRSGALVLFTYTHDMIQQIQRMSHLEPLLRELGPMLDQYSPERIVFDPVDNLLAGANQVDLTDRANQLAVWVRSSGATVVLVANEENRGVLDSLAPVVSESFRFEVREILDRVVRFIAFEKSSWIPDQAVRVDPSRGISLLEDQQANKQSNERLGVVSVESAGVEACVSNVEGEEPKLTDRDSTVFNGTGFSPASKAGASNANMGRPLATEADDLGTAIAPEEARDAFFAMLDELQSFVSSLDPDVAETETNEIPHKSLNTRLPEPELAGLPPHD